MAPDTACRVERVGMIKDDQIVRRIQAEVMLGLGCYSVTFHRFVSCMSGLV